MIARRAAHAAMTGRRWCFQQGDKWFIASSGAPPKPGEEALKTDAMEMRVDPKEEWRQIYHRLLAREGVFFIRIRTRTAWKIMKAAEEEIPALRRKHRQP